MSESQDIKVWEQTSSTDTNPERTERAPANDPALGTDTAGPAVNTGQRDEESEITWLSSENSHLFTIWIGADLCCQSVNNLQQVSRLFLVGCALFIL